MVTVSDRFLRCRAGLSCGFEMTDHSLPKLFGGERLGDIPVSPQIIGESPI